MNRDVNELASDGSERPREHNHNGEITPDRNPNAARIRPPPPSPGGRRDDPVDIKIRYPVEGIIDCQACRDQGGVSTFLEVKDMVKHAKAVHGQHRLALECRACTKEFPGLKNITSHMPRCPGAPLVEQGDHQCQACNRRFQTQRGLSTHERNAHPDLRNQARMEQRAPRAAVIVGRRAAPKIWTAEEEALLEELEVRFRGARNINQLMEPLFPGKTNRQIRSKRSDNTRRLDRQAEAAERAAVEMYETFHPPGLDNDTDNDTTTDFEVFRPAAEVELDLDEETRLWKKALAASAVRTFHKQKTTLSRAGYEIGRQLETVAQQVRASPEVTPELLKDLDSAILQTSRMVRKDPFPEKKGQRANKRRRGKNNRLARRRRNYARLQELARRDMKQLAHIVAEDRLGDLEDPNESLPPSGDVRDLYHSLWGVRGETSFPPVWERKVDPIAAAVLIPPIQLSTVQKRLSALKADTAAGRDGIEKGDVTPECLVLLTMAFNICLATGHYPASWRTNRTTLIPKAGKDQSLVANWRPITIGSIFGRLFSGVIDACLRQHVRKPPPRRYRRKQQWEVTLAD